MTARIAVSFHPELDGRSKREESTLYAHYENGRLMGAEIAGVLFTVAQLRALAEASGWSWELFLRELRYKAEDQRAPFDFVPVEARCG
jgi:hypothetical protein